MSEIYLNKTDAQIQEIIKAKLEIYPDSFQEDIWIRSKIFLPNTFFVLQCYCQHHGLDPAKHDIYRSMAMHDGTELYNFYNIVEKKAESESS